MKIDIEEEEREEPTDYEQDILEARIEGLLAQWENVQPFRFTGDQEDEEAIVTNPSKSKLPAVGLAKGLLLYNVIKESLINPNKVTIISKRTGRIIHHPSNLP